MKIFVPYQSLDILVHVKLAALTLNKNIPQCNKIMLQFI